MRCPGEPSLRSIDTRAPYVVDYPAENGGKTAHDMLRRRATTGEEGPWSETPNAMIAGQRNRRWSRSYGIVTRLWWRPPLATLQEIHNDIGTERDGSKSR